MKNNLNIRLNCANCAGFCWFFAENRNVFCHVPSKKSSCSFLTDAVLMPAKVFPGGDMCTFLMPPLFFLLNLLHGRYSVNTTRCLKRG